MANPSKDGDAQLRGFDANAGIMPVGPPNLPVGEPEICACFVPEVRSLPRSPLS